MLSIAVVGNTPSAWISALYIRRCLGAKVSLILPPAPAQVDSFAYAQSLSPMSMREFHQLGLDESALVAQTQGTYLLANRLLDDKHRDAILAYGDIGAALNGINFQHYFVKLRGQNYEQYSLACAMARQNKFVHPTQNQGSILSTFAYGLALTQDKTIALVAQQAKVAGVEVIQADQLMLARQQNQISSIAVTADRHIKADCYIDATDSQTLISNSSYSYSTLNRRLTVCSSQALSASCVRNVKAHKGGFLVSLSLPSKMTYKFYFDGNIHGDEWARENLQALVGKQHHEYAIFESLDNSEEWHGNCLSLSSRCINPCPLLLSDWDILLKKIAIFCELAPVKGEHGMVSKEYKRVLENYYQCLSEYQDIAYNGKVNDRVALYQSSANIMQRDRDPIAPKMWVNLMLALNIQPRQYSPLLDMMNNESAFKQLLSIPSLIQKSINKMPSLPDYLVSLSSQYRG